MTFRCVMINRIGSNFPSDGEILEFFAGAQLNSPILSEFLQTFYSKIPITTFDFFAEQNLY